MINNLEKQESKISMERNKQILVLASSANSNHQVRLRARLLQTLSTKRTSKSSESTLSRTLKWWKTTSETLKTKQLNRITTKSVKLTNLLKKAKRRSKSWTKKKTISKWKWPTSTTITRSQTLLFKTKLSEMTAKFREPTLMVKRKWSSATEWGEKHSQTGIR